MIVITRNQVFCLLKRSLNALSNAFMAQFRLAQEVPDEFYELKSQYENAIFIVKRQCFAITVPAIAPMIIRCFAATTVQAIAPAITVFGFFVQRLSAGFALYPFALMASGKHVAKARRLASVCSDYLRNFFILFVRPKICIANLNFAALFLFARAGSVVFSRSFGSA